MEKITSNNPESKSLDILANNIEKLKEIFPEVVSENRVDFEKLQLLLNDAISPKDDLYGLNWWGKNDAIREAMKPSLGTLRPAKDESVNWDTTENLYIEGDNLEVLKLLQKSYNGKVKMIYIDPPYNTGKDFVYKDNFKDNLNNYLTQTGQIDDEGVKQSTNSKDDGRYHSNWLNMMYPRLKLARNLLKEGGVIFISIDDNEEDNLKKICDEIYGEINFLGKIIWQRAFSPKNDSKHISTSHDFILIYSKNISFTDCLGLPRDKDNLSRYTNPDQDHRGSWQSSTMTVSNGTDDYMYELITPSGNKFWPPAGRFWVYNKKRYEELVVDNRIWFGNEGNGVPRIKTFLSEVKQRINPISIWLHSDVGHSQGATQELKKLFNDKKYFDYPKPIELIKRCLKLYTKDEGEEIILDFFSGSATTAQAVIQLNSEDSGDRKHIMVQLPETTDEKSEAYKAGYKTIAEIGKERIRRAGTKILSEKIESLKALQDKKALTDDEQTEKEKLEQIVEKLDIGFKVFKLDSSNIEAWNTEMPQTLEEIQYKLEHSEENIKDGRKEDDLLYEFLLKQGHLLTAPIEEKKFGNDTIYNVNQGELFVCLTDKITTELVTAIGEWAEECISNSIVDLKPVLILKDNAFLGNDSLKTNTELTLCSQFGFAKINTI